jgi:ATP-dependent helicase/DNAse subunit B
MVLIAVEKIKKGEIKPSPLKNGNKSTCDYCEYVGLCKFSEKQGNEYNTYKKVKTVGELEN